MRPLLVIFLTFSLGLAGASAMTDDYLSPIFESLKGKFSQSDLSLPSEDDINAIEKEIGFSFPNDLRRFYLEVSNLDFKFYDPATANAGVSSDLYKVINKSWTEGITNEWIAFCEAEGNYFCIHKVTEAVSFIPIIPGYKEENYLNLADWIEQIYFASES